MTDPADTINVLVVDDIAQNIAAVASAIARPGLRLLEAGSGTEALELLLRHEVALALIDVRMPGMDGFELAELMRGVERSRGVPIIFMTAASQDPMRTFKGYEAGAVDFLHKPFDPRILRSKVDVFVELFAQRRRLSEQLLELKNALRLNEMFGAVLGHDLRNPLHAIALSAELLVRQSTDPNVIALGERIRGSAKRMARMIEQLLDLARIRSGGLALNTSELDLARVLAPILDELVGPRNQGRVTLHSRGDTTAAFDADRLSQVFSNLVGNALQHGDRSSPVSVSLDGSEPDRLLVEVRNRGTIAPEHMHTLFEPFKSAKPGAGGLGLGLYIAKQLAEAHGASLQAASDAEGYTSFVVSLPRRGLPQRAKLTL
ncbi:MAG: hybrid sensor histidine kinase/response regulator [Burkholderiales bacterium]|nr:hybrid sensor histidine kinase/response regulator [Burkholderiales bacterium]